MTKNGGGDETIFDRVMHFIMLLAVSGHNVYYVYFSLFFLLFLLLYKFFKREQTKAWLDFAIISMGFAINCIPIVVSRIIYGKNNYVANRNPSEVETYALKISQLIMPIEGHRISLLANLAEKYSKYPLTNENAWSSLGLLMSIGFIFLLIGLFLEFDLKDKTSIYYSAVKFNAATLLLACVGGFSTFISFFFSSIRAYNRICQYIAFFSLIAFLILLEVIENKINKKAMMIALIIGLTCIGVFDQTSEECIPKYDDIKARWDCDEDFISQIEAIEEPEAAIYEMPYMFYPEAGNINDMKDYDQLMGVLHSDSLKWSYGAFRGRESDLWYQQLQEYDLETQIKMLASQDFAGVCVFKSGMGDDFSDVMTGLKDILGVEPIISTDGNMYYFTFREYYSDHEIKKSEIDNIFCSYQDGFYTKEFDGEGNSWYWCKKKGTVVICNMNEETVPVKLSFDVSFIEGNVQELSVNNREQELCLNSSHNEISIELMPGINEISFTCSGDEVVPGNGEDRALAFCIVNPELVVE